MWLYDETTDISTSDHEDSTWIGCESTWSWLYDDDLFVGDCADSCEPAIRGFWDDGFTLIWSVF